MHVESSTSKQVLPKRSSSIDFVGYVEAVLGHAGEYPSCTIRESRPDETDEEDTVPLARPLEVSCNEGPERPPRAPRIALSVAEADEILFGAEITGSRSVVDEIAVEDILEEVYIEDDPPPQARAIVTPLHAGFRHEDLPVAQPAPIAFDAGPPIDAPAPTSDLPILERTNARRGRGVGSLALAVAGVLLLLGSAGAAAAVVNSSASKAPPTSAVQTMAGQWTAPVPSTASPASTVPVVSFESLPRAR